MKVTAARIQYALLIAVAVLGALLVGVPAPKIAEASTYPGVPTRR
jgi:hypothetical protein